MTAKGHPTIGRIWARLIFKLLQGGARAGFALSAPRSKPRHTDGKVPTSRTIQVRKMARQRNCDHYVSENSRLRPHRKPDAAAFGKESRQPGARSFGGNALSKDASADSVIRRPLPRS